ncbi:MAG: PDZ domain-containing protein [Planctomycetota bacterium]|jgi:S1-C subfamily serine protease
MANRTQFAFAGFFSQLAVVCLLTVLIALTLYAMFSTGGGIDEMQWIGMSVTPLEPATAAALGMPSDSGGVMVGEVDGIAQRAGLRHGDVLVGINGKPVRDMAGFAGVTREVDVAKNDAQLDVIRRGSRISILIRQGGASPSPTPMQPTATPGEFVAAPGVMDRKWLGIEAETFTPGEGGGRNVPMGVGGVRIDGVARGSRAEQAGLAPRDVIVTVNGIKVNTPPELWSLLGSLNERDRVEFGVFRGGRLRSVALPIPGGIRVGGFPGSTAGQGWVSRQVWVCPKCGSRAAPRSVVPCASIPCPACGEMMKRAP